MRVRSNMTLVLVGVCLIGLSTGCKKKVAVAPPPPAPVQEAPPPAPQPPTASITADPAMVETGQAVTLKWSTSNATTVTISGLGEVTAEGNQEVHPRTAITYELVAKGPGGSATVSATVDVITPPPPIGPPSPPVVTKSLQERITSELSDVYFDYDRSEIREDGRAALAKDVEALRAILTDFPNAKIVLEGHCDERGSAEYNLGLGDRRASSANAYLEALGIPTERLTTVSYGKEKPQCEESTEACWQTNRRVHFASGDAPVTAN